MAAGSKEVSFKDLAYAWGTTTATVNYQVLKQLNNPILKRASERKGVMLEA
jgi:hypothetical protein